VPLLFFAITLVDVDRF